AAYEAGVLLVAAAGNTFGGEPVYPASYDSVIAVTGTDRDDQPGWFSPLGPQIELAAPGVAVSSSASGGGETELSGTSQAAPHVTGTAALIMSAGIRDLNDDGLADNRDVRIQLHSSALDLGETGHDNVYGHGLVDATGALDDLDDEVILQLVKRRRRADSSQGITLQQGQYEIMIKNKSLLAIHMKVMENGKNRGDLSKVIRFFKRRSQTMTFMIDATAADLKVIFTPVGGPGTTATVIVEKEIILASPLNLEQ
ncbi:MAG: S8 family serine peptidase, partial [Proteobacteria bacterium]|nr:S8 family serine peptidase [Pseudomonadota bacterium]